MVNLQKIDLHGYVLYDSKKHDLVGNIYIDHDTAFRALNKIILTGELDDISHLRIHRKPIVFTTMAAQEKKI